ncbi:MAG TPA: SUMF1/EgtB/PvdO family nonheme iron enzyme, partial [Pseudomonas sp.]|nr:SUMF1/EgtB/PvdO family nonheme iron enzyme [Pseudomonas sp.]
MRNILYGQPLQRLGALMLLALLGSAVPSLAQAYTAPLPGKVFKDCRNCPEMVVLPAGTFTMGTPEGEVGREPDEGPMHEVTFEKPFAMSRYQITAGEWAQYMKETGVTLPDGDTRPGRACTNGKPSYPQGPRQPAVCMNFAEVTAYVAWLSRKTGQHYHIVSEAQREYAARAGSTGPFPFPFDPGTEYSIATHANTYGPTDGYSHSSPVGSYPPNAFGMYDMHGNVYEWIADCYHP